MLHKYKRKEADVLSEKGQLKSLSFDNWKTCQLNDELAQKYKIFSKGNCVCESMCTPLYGWEQGDIDSCNIQGFLITPEVHLPS